MDKKHLIFMSSMLIANTCRLQNEGVNPEDNSHIHVPRTHKVTLEMIVGQNTDI